MNAGDLSDGIIRVVKVAGCYCPCGGTHVRSSSEIGSIKITKVKVKSGNTRVGYSIDSPESNTPGPAEAGSL